MHSAVSVAPYSSKLTAAVMCMLHCVNTLQVELIAAHTGSAANALFTYDALSGDEDNDDNDGPTTQSIAQVIRHQNHHNNWHLKL
jgi:hypothetical protein